MGKAIAKTGTSAAVALPPLTRRFATSTKPLTKPEAEQYLAHVRGLSVEADRTAGMAMYDGALLLYRAHQSGSIGKDAVFSSQNDYARRAGFDPAYGTRLRRIGVAIVEFKVDHGTDVFRFLCRNAQSGKVGKVLAGKPDDLHDYAGNETTEPGSYAGSRLLQVWTAEWLAGTFRSGDDRQALPASEKDAGGESGADGGDAAVVVENVAPTLDQIIAALDAAVKGLDADAWIACEQRLAKVIERENTLRAKAAATPRKGRGKRS